MISLYTGTPGSGKSLHAAQQIYYRLLSKNAVISTFEINTEVVSKKGKKRIGKYIHKPIEDISVEFLKEYAAENHKVGKESQTLVLIDECQLIFNSRMFQQKDRLEWIYFFTQHRKYGFDFILITQFDRLIDRQIRCLIEFEYKHLKMNHKGLIGMLLPFALFSVKKYWYAINEFMDGTAFFYSKKIASMYNTFEIVDKSVKNGKK